MRNIFLGIFILIVFSGCVVTDGLASGTSPLQKDEYQLTKWKRGIWIRPQFQAGREMYLWFYEWNLFGAFDEGKFTQGHWHFDNRISKDGKSAVLSSEERGVILKILTSERGADMELTVTNKSDRDWGPLASIVPCLNPAPAHGSKKIIRKSRTTEFINTKTYYLTKRGLKKINGRVIQFDSGHIKALLEYNPNLTFDFSDRWPKAGDDALATGGLLVRESNNGEWVAGIAWDDSLSVQAHNPWDCMHVSIRIGPLKQGQTKTIRGKIYLFKGTKEEALKLYQTELPDVKRGGDLTY